MDVDTAELDKLCRGKMSAATQAAEVRAAKNLAARLGYLKNRYSLDQLQTEMTGGAAGVTVAQLDS